jgi:hypothetical protein
VSAGRARWFWLDSGAERSILDIALTNTGGTMALLWDKTLASVPFNVGGM